MNPPRVRSRPASRESASATARNAVGSNPGGVGLGGMTGRDRSTGPAPARVPARVRAPAGSGPAPSRLDRGCGRRVRRGASAPAAIRRSVVGAGSSKSAGSGSQPGATSSGRTTSGAASVVGRLGLLAPPSPERHQRRRRASSPRSVGERLGLVEPEADDAADRVVADGHAVQRVGRLDRAAVVGDDDELRLVGEAAQGIGEPADVRLVERGVDLVEHAERDRSDLEHREQQGDGGQGPLAARQHRQRLRLLAGRPGDDLDAGRAEVRRVGQRQPGVPAAEQLLEPRARRRSRAPGTSSGTGRRSSCPARR